jgi:cytochrome oxidase Cu insertion factor (SCO1/SenC/PrrC family)
LSIAKAEVLRYGGKKSIFIPEDSMKFSTGIVVLLLAMAISGVSFAAAVSNIHPSGQGLPGYEVGSPAPTFSLDAVVNQEFKKVSLSDYQGKWVLLFFYPGDFTFVCPTEIKGFNKALSEFTTANTQVLLPG